MGALLIHRRAHAIFWRALAATCAALALGVCSPALASAATNPGTVDIDSTGLLSYDAVPGQTNNVAVEYSRLAIKVTDTGATLVAGESCMQTDDVHVVLCPRGLTTAPDWSEIRYDFRLGNSNDLFIINVEASSGVSASGFVDGGEGNDLLIGGAGDDTILGGGGSDTIGGTAGTDTAVYLGNDSRTIDLDGAVGDDGGANDGSPGSRDTIASSINTVIAGGDGSDTITGNSQENLLYGGGGNDTVNGAGGYDQLYGDLPQVGLPADIWALTEASSDGADSLDGGAGNDVLHGAGGADDFVGGSGLDRVSYSDHEDAIVATIGGAADDGNSLDGLGGSRDNIHSDVEGIQGTSGDDTLTGGISNDFLDGDDGDDTLDGGDGNDLLHGGNGANSLDGGNGDDEFEASYFIEEADEYVGGAGTDTMSYAWRSEDPVTVTLDDIANDGTGAEADNVGSDIENIVGGSEDDVLVGSSAANRIAGGPGEDDITGADGDDNIVVGGFTGVYNDFNDDVVDAGDGDDRIYASADDTVDCGVGSDTASVDSGSPLNCETVNPPDEESSPSPGTVSIHHGTVHYTAEGGKANLVTVSSDSRYLTLVDTGATVTLTPGPGCVAGPNVQTVLCDLTVNWHSWNASLNLGDGNDSAVHTGASSWTTRTVAMNVVGGSGNDTITGGPDNDDIAGGTGADTLDGGDGTDLLSYRDHGWSVVVDFAVSGSEHGGSEDGSVGARDTIAGFEDIEGGLGSDTLVGNDYRNSLTGLAGNDTMSGNGGNDTLVGSEGTDSLSGGDDEDELDGGDDADVINGGAGADTVTYAERSQAVTINLGAAGSTQGSALDGLGGSRDTIQLVEHALGGQGNDTIAGSAAANLLDGGWGDDTINGSSGDDTIIGGDGQDTMLGGTGDDAVLMGSEFVPEGDSVSGGAGVDVADYSYRSAPVAIDLDDVADDGVVGEADNIRSDVEDVLGGYDVSVITGNASDNFIADGEVSSSDTISTLAGNDIVRMRYGGDAVDLGSGNDRVMARNGEVDTINCGPDLDVASVDQVADGDSVSDVLTGCENINPVSIKQVAGAGDTVQTSGSTSTEHPVALSLLSPNSGIVSMDESVVTQTQPEGMTFLAIQMDVTAPNATVTSPLRLTFTLDGSILPSSGEVQVFRDGVAATDCTGPSGHAIPDPCVESRTSISGGDLQLVVLSSHASLWNFGTPTPQISTPPSTTPESGAGGGGGAVDGGTDTGGKNPTADADTTAPTLKFALKPKQKLGRVLKSGLAVDATCSETCAVSARLRLDPKQAKKLKLSSDFGTVKVKRTGAGKLAIRWVMKNKARSRLKTGKSARFILELKATDAAGNVRTTRRAVTIKR